MLNSHVNNTPRACMTQEPQIPLGREIAERILSLQKPNEIDAAFGRRVGISSQVINNWRSGRGGASVDTVADVASRAGLDANWLITGDGEPYKPLASLSVAQTAVEEIAAVIDRIRRESTSTASDEPIQAMSQARQRAFAAAEQQALRLEEEARQRLAAPARKKRSASGGSGTD